MSPNLRGFVDSSHFDVFVIAVIWFQKTCNRLQNGVEQLSGHRRSNDAVERLFTNLLLIFLVFLVQITVELIEVQHDRIAEIGLNKSGNRQEDPRRERHH